jgi:hypothetical protein
MGTVPARPPDPIPEEGSRGAGPGGRSQRVDLADLTEDETYHLIVDGALEERLSAIHGQRREAPWPATSVDGSRSEALPVPCPEEGPPAAGPPGAPEQEGDHRPRHHPDPGDPSRRTAAAVPGDPLGEQSTCPLCLEDLRALGFSYRIVLRCTHDRMP